MSQLDDLHVTHQLLLLRLANDEANKMWPQYVEIAKNIREEILLGAPLTSLGKRDLNTRIRELNDILELIAPDLEPIAEYELDWNLKTYAENQPAEGGSYPAVAIATGVALAYWARYSDAQGLLDGVTQQAKNVQTETIRKMVASGATNEEIARALTGDMRTDKGGEPLKRMIRGSDARLKSEIMAVAGIIRDVIVRENPNAFSYAQHVSTIDGKTTNTCIARHLKIWSLPDYEPVNHRLPFAVTPLHPNCRSLIRYYRTGEISLAQLNEAQSDFTGYLKRNPTVANEVLGKGRAELYLAGKITLSDLVDNRNNAISLQNLKQQV